MIVVATIGLLTTIAIPNFLAVREKATSARFIADLRTAKGAFELHALERHGYPADRTPGVVPLGMAEYLGDFPWTSRNSLGGMWDWDYLQFGCVAGVSVYQPAASISQLQSIDDKIDDGNLDTGSFRARSSGYISVIE